MNFNDISKERWQAAYAPPAALDARLRETLAALPEKSPRRAAPRRALALALALSLALVSTAAAAGLLRSRRYDARLLAAQAMEEKYGVTREMETFFDISVEENGSASTVTYAPLDANGYPERLGTYTVTVSGGEATASWSHDGAALKEGMDAPVWGASQMAEGIARREAGEDWYQILATMPLAGVTLTQEQAVAAAQEAVVAKYGPDAAKRYCELNAELLDAAWRNFAPTWRILFWPPEDTLAPDTESLPGIVADIDAATGEVAQLRWSGDARYAILPEGDLAAHAEAAREFVECGGLEALPVDQQFAAAERLRAAGMGALIAEDYADPALAAIDAGAAEALAVAALQEAYGLTDAHLTLFAAKTAFVIRGDQPVYETTLSPTPGERPDSFLTREGSVRFADRIGTYAAQIDAESGEALGTEWSLAEKAVGGWTAETFGRSEAYDADCLTFLLALYDACGDDPGMGGGYGWDAAPERMAEIDGKMRAAGFDAGRYNHTLPGEGELTLDEAEAAAREALSSDMGVPESELADISFYWCECTEEESGTVWKLTASEPNGPGSYRIAVRARDGMILDAEYDSGAAGNG